jgi:hypothetical protein
MPDTKDNYIVLAKLYEELNHSKNLLINTDDPIMKIVLEQRVFALKIHINTLYGSAGIRK